MKCCDKCNALWLCFFPQLLASNICVVKQDLLNNRIKIYGDSLG